MTRLARRLRVRSYPVGFRVRDRLRGIGYASLGAAILGRADHRARKQIDQAFTLARVKDSRAIDEAVNNYAVESHLYGLLRDPERTRESAAATVALATELGNPFRHAIGSDCPGLVYMGWAASPIRQRG